MRAFVLLILIPLAAPLSARQIDYAKSSITFEATSRLGNVRGTFSDWTFQGALDPEIRGTLQVKTASISTGNSSRDNHLRTDDFFACDSFPLATFQIQKDTQGADAITLDGILSLHGVSKPLQLKFTRAQNVWSTRFVISRKDFGMNYASMLNPIGDTVQVFVSLAVLQ